MDRVFEGKGVLRIGIRSSRCGLDPEVAFGLQKIRQTPAGKDLWTLPFHFFVPGNCISVSIIEVHIILLSGPGYF
jgi:hypothetical protein